MHASTGGRAIEPMHVWDACWPLVWRTGRDWRWSPLPNTAAWSRRVHRRSRAHSRSVFFFFPLPLRCFHFLFLFPIRSADEKNYRSDMKSTFESGQRWEKVNKLISTAPRPNEKAGTSRVERMRKLLIQLKTEKKQ